MHNVSIDVSYLDAENINVNCSSRTDKESEYQTSVGMNGLDFHFDATEFGSHSDCSVDVFWSQIFSIPANFSSNSLSPTFICKIKNNLYNSTREATQEFIISRDTDS